MDKTPEELYRSRLQRIEDAIQLKVPDRVPFFPLTHFLAAKHAGITAEEAFYSYDKWFSANKNLTLDLEPDLYFPATAAYPGPALDALDCKQLRWPGHGVTTASTYQFIEGEYMKAEEYDAFLNDPSDFILRVYMPRIFGTLEPFKMLPSIKSLFIQGYKGAVTSAVLTIPEVFNAFESLYKAGQEAMKFIKGSVQLDRSMKELGFPSAYGGTSVYAPFDIVSDMLRGMRGTMLDMYQRPDKLLEVLENLFPMLVEQGVSGAKRTGNPRVFMPLHRGADGFMSPKQFETFYWPGLKKLFLALIDEGLTPCPFFEGNYDTRLEYLTDLPKGKIAGIFDTTDIFRAKEILGDTMCILGNMPVSLLKTGTPEQIKDYSRKLIDVVGKGGGFIMSSRGVLDDAEPELVKIWGEYTKEYGVYS